MCVDLFQETLRNTTKCQYEIPPRPTIIVQQQQHANIWKMLKAVLMNLNLFVCVSNSAVVVVVYSNV